MERGAGDFNTTGTAAAGGADAASARAWALGRGSAVSVASARSWILGILASSLDATPPKSDACVKKSAPVLDPAATLAWSSCASFEGISAAGGRLHVDTAWDPVPRLFLSGLRPILESVDEKAGALEGLELSAGGCQLNAAVTHFKKSVSNIFPI